MATTFSQRGLTSRCSTLSGTMAGHKEALAAHRKARSAKCERYRSPSPWAPPLPSRLRGDAIRPMDPRPRPRRPRLLRPRRRRLVYRLRRVPSAFCRGFYLEDPLSRAAASCAQRLATPPRYRRRIYMFTADRPRSAGVHVLVIEISSMIDFLSSIIRRSVQCCHAPFRKRPTCSSLST